MTGKQERAIWFIGHELRVAYDGSDPRTFIGRHLPAARAAAAERNRAELARLEALPPVATTFSLSGRTAARDSLDDASSAYAEQRYPMAWNPRLPGDGEA